MSKNGAASKAAFDKAKGELERQVRRGQSPDHRSLRPRNVASVPEDISAYFPDPVQEYGLDPDAPEDQDELEKLRVHIDAIKPVWRTDLKAEWFDLLDPNFKRLMHPVRRCQSARLARAG